MDANYISIMEEGINNKVGILEFLNHKLPVVDVGSSTGSLTFEIDEIMRINNNTNKIICLEPDCDTFKELSHSTDTFSNVQILKMTLDQFLAHNKNAPMNFVLSSVLHEMVARPFVASHWRDGKPSFDAKRRMCVNYIKGLIEDIPAGSRIIIRDGVAPNRENDTTVLKCTPTSLHLAKLFFKKFGQWNDLTDLNGNSIWHITGRNVTAPKWLITEMLLTITWGEKSLERECNEHYTVMLLQDYIDILKELSSDILYAECLFQPGYQMFLPKLGKLTNENHFQIPYPFTNQIIVADI